MPLTIALLGAVGATRDGVPVTRVRGRKAWALLAYLLLAGSPVPRDRLARVFFPDAGDPAGVLRWNLSQLRRHLGIGVEGDPVTLTLPAGASVDVDVLQRRDAEGAAATPGLGEDLLAGAWPGEGAAFEVWLEAERRHLRALSADVLREAALQGLARNDHEQAVRLAERVVELEPLDENAAVLLVRALRAADRPDEARAAAASGADRLRRELGTEPGAALQAALHARPGGRRGTSGRRTVEANREGGTAALAAGATDTGLDLLREALGGARALDDPAMLAPTLTALGSALVHAVRGTDQDAVALLHEAVSVHERTGPSPALTTALRELGYVEMLRGRYPRAAGWFARAADVAGEDPVEHAWIHTFAGAVHTDVTDYDRAGAALDAAVGTAEEAGPGVVRTMARSMRGRLRLLTGDVDAAAEDLDRAIDLAAEHGLRAVAPWPTTLRAELDLLAGDVTGATERLERAHATARQIGDPCWEAMALRGLGLVRVEQGDLAEGVGLLGAAPAECRRLPDTYLWIEAYALDALTALGVDRGHHEAGSWARSLDELASAHGMRALSLAAARHRAALGEPGAADLVEARAGALTGPTGTRPPSGPEGPGLVGAGGPAVA